MNDSESNASDVPADGITLTEELQPCSEIPPVDNIGPYRVIREIGSGGMGTVFLAERADDSYRKLVAIKLIRLDLGAADLVVRFRRERQILATLEHPHVARFLDGGTTERGEPYFVMEYIEGLPLDRYCEANGLTVEQRLALFRQVCDAVQHAHRSLIVHRDIKPGNVLVTPQGTPKLLDFGIAKLLHPGLWEGDSPTLTPFGPLTPEFASPEQVRGEPVTTGSDVYSLGVTLYLVLTGCSPYSPSTANPLDVLRAVTEQEPDFASAAVARRGRASGGPAQKPAEKLSRRLRGDLDTILGTALQKEPRRRYASVEAFSEDIRRHLEGLPILARPATLGYRSRKFVARHRWGVTAVAGCVMLLLSFTVATRMQARAIATERDRAEAVTRFLLQLFEVADPSEARGRDLTVRQVLDRGRLRLGSSLAHQPELRASLQETMGRVYTNLGLWKEAGTLLESAVETRRSLGIGGRASLAEGLTHLGFQSVKAGDTVRALSLYQESLRLQELEGATDKALYSLTLRRLAGAKRKLGRLKEARADADKALAVADAATGPESLETAQAWIALSAVQGDQADSAAALQSLGRAMPILEGILGPDHPDVVKALEQVGWEHKELGQYEQAQTFLARAVELNERVLGQSHPDTAWSVNNLGLVLMDKGDLEAAKAAFERADRIWVAALGEDGIDRTKALNNLGIVAKRQRRYAEAIAYYETSLAIREQRVGRDSPLVALVLNNLGTVYEQARRFEESRACHERALAIRRASLGDEHPLTASSMQNLGNALFELGHRQEAAAMAKRAVASFRSVRGPTHPETLSALCALAEKQAAWGETRDAESAAIEILAAPPVKPGEIGWTVRIRALLVLGRLRGPLGGEVCEGPIREAMEMLRRTSLPEDPALLEDSVALLRQCQGRRGAASIGLPPPSPR